MPDNSEIKSLEKKYELLEPYLNEKNRRLWAAIEAQSLGRGGISQVARATGLSRTTIYAGMRLLSESSTTY
jgi:DNA-binding phage protein